MHALATNDEPRIKISTIELEAPEKPYTIETLTKLKNHYENDARIFFVMGADSWNEINTWREWQRLLLLTDFIVVTRPEHEIETAHVTPEIAAKIVDLRTSNNERRTTNNEQIRNEQRIFITDAVQLDISSTAIRREISLQKGENWRKLVAESVVNYIKKYKLYI
jgi:nicotinate-nucleotide adenylyltransferase